MRRAAKLGSGLILWLALWLVLPVLGAEETIPVAQPPAAGQAAPDAAAPMTDIHDIRPPVPVGFDAPWLIPILSALAVVAILAAAWWWRRKTRQNSTILTIVPELPPEMIAMQALDRISDVRGLHGKTFYFFLSAILRRYVFGRYAVGAPEMTTEEFVPCIDRLPIDRELARQLKQLCRAMDPIKFGSVAAAEKQMETDLLFARAFVRRTTPEHAMENRTGDNQASTTPVRGEG
ncbi:DUF4381 family protein [Desulfosarcina sp.]|uniref:DUF4381 family protein n=1 Tax=Desulfosarcina sp. TaxID=2027861 RepID=UPI00397047B3